MACDFLIVQRYDNIVLAKVTKERLLEPQVIAALADDLNAEIQRASQRLSLVLDLSDVGYLSSAMIGKLVAVNKGVRALKGRMAIAGLKPALLQMFKVTGLDKLFEFSPEAEQVILAYRRNRL
jgi:anti-sigma B factor antagonist